MNQLKHVQDDFSASRFATIQPTISAVPAMTTAVGAEQLNQKNEARQYRRMYFVFFSIFFMFVLAGRLLPRKWRPFADELDPKRSVIGETKSLVNRVLPYVFMA